MNKEGGRTEGRREGEREGEAHTHIELLNQGTGDHSKAKFLHFMRWVQFTVSPYEVASKRAAGHKVHR
jgi:hypothetical protein